MLVTWLGEGNLVSHHADDAVSSRQVPFDQPVVSLDLFGMTFSCGDNVLTYLLLIQVPALASQCAVAQERREVEELSVQGLCIVGQFACTIASVSIYIPLVLLLSCFPQPFPQPGECSILPYTRFPHFLPVEILPAVPLCVDIHLCSYDCLGISSNSLESS